MEQIADFMKQLYEYFYLKLNEIKKDLPFRAVIIVGIYLLLKYNKNINVRKLVDKWIIQKLI